MELIEAIRTRRSIGRVKPDPVPCSLIEDILEAAVWAPDHFHAEPWRFFVMEGEGRSVLGEAYAQIALQQQPDLPEGEQAAVREKHHAKAQRAPVVIAVGAVLPEEGDVRRREELAATHAAVHNLLLAAHSKGLGAIWRSGEPMYDVRMKQAFGLAAKDEIVALVYLGYPAFEPKTPPRAPAADKTVWL
ncbi:nitroreductase [Paenibacillus sp. IB182496]|uniref:Putative NAD(P)H nitroreductase n=1 Tax=Paenibacillus sabuli TaxID=2772509 RepID=A0A927GT66_9BACL|nr:nitroreductase [Paenibacillus sabuli]MBD2847021.1 nitroreductase [Paenibacillus sabuli]